MVSRIIPVDACDFYIFGGTGDLTYRKLLPALWQRYLQGQLVPGTKIFSLSRSKISSKAYRDEARQWLEKSCPDTKGASKAFGEFLASLHHLVVDATEVKQFQKIHEASADDQEKTKVFYLAMAPQLYGKICANLAASKLIDDQCRVVLEKPLGWDHASAEAINQAVGKVFREEQIYRIDHYLGKETVQNLMALRFANALFEPLWNAAHVNYVQITVAEELGVEGRAGYYEGSGAMRDMVQNHILQLLCLIAMEPPTTMDADSLRDEKLKVLKSLRPIAGDDARKLTIRGQYQAGSSNGAAVQAYSEEEGVAEGSNTETFVAIQAELDNWRWSGVPFYLRTGKRLASRVSEVVVSFRGIRHSIFPGDSGDIHENRLVIRLQPNEGITLEIMIKEPGPGGFRLRRVPLDVSFKEDIGLASPEAYERLLMDVVRGNQTLFMRRDEVAAAWNWVDPIIEAWQRTPEDMKRYNSGTWGPTASAAMLANLGHQWSEDL